MSKYAAWASISLLVPDNFYERNLRKETNLYTDYLTYIQQPQPEEKAPRVQLHLTPTSGLVTPGLQ